MKFWFSVLYIFVSFIGFSQVKLDLKKDFKAKGDGKADDTKAFLMAAEKINGLRTRVALFIPAGTYIVHPQKTAPPEDLKMGSAISEREATTNPRVYKNFLVLVTDKTLLAIKRSATTPPMFENTNMLK